MEVATKTQPTEEQWADLLFAWRVVRHVRSNAIVLARGGATLGIGAGQMSRVDSVRIAIEKAREARGPDVEQLLAGSVIASDAFFPFADGAQTAIDAGVSAVIQPGGSKRDAEVIEACDQPASRWSSRSAGTSGTRGVARPIDGEACVPAKLPGPP